MHFCQSSNAKKKKKIYFSFDITGSPQSLALNIIIKIYFFKSRESGLAYLVNMLFFFNLVSVSESFSLVQHEAKWWEMGIERMFKKGETAFLWKFAFKILAFIRVQTLTFGNCKIYATIPYYFFICVDRSISIEHNEKTFNNFKVFF